MNKNNIFPGIILITLGTLFLLRNTFGLEIFSLTYFWPIFILIPGLLLETSFFFSNAGVGVLVPGGILISLSLLFFFEILTNWNYADITWPFYIMSVTIGLFQLYIFSKEKKGLIKPVIVLGIITLFCFGIVFFEYLNLWSHLNTVMAGICFIIGFYFLLKRH